MLRASPTSPKHPPPNWAILEQSTEAELFLTNSEERRSRWGLHLFWRWRDQNSIASRESPTGNSNCTLRCCYRRHRFKAGKEDLASAEGEGGRAGNVGLFEREKGFVRETGCCARIVIVEGNDLCLLWGFRFRDVGFLHSFTH